jgi:predicted nucleic acid-binding Zn ribbon protein
MRFGGDDPRPLRDALTALGDDLGLPRAAAFTGLAERWADVVGDDVAAHVRVESLRDGCLTVTADSTIWASQFRYLEDVVRERAAAVVGANVVRTVRVRVVPVRRDDPVA